MSSPGSIISATLFDTLSNVTNFSSGRIAFQNPSQQLRSALKFVSFGLSNIQYVGKSLSYLTLPAVHRIIHNSVANYRQSVLWTSENIATREPGIEMAPSLKPPTHSSLVKPQMQTKASFTHFTPFSKHKGGCHANSARRTHTLGQHFSLNFLTVLLTEGFLPNSVRKFCNATTTVRVHAYSKCHLSPCSLVFTDYAKNRFKTNNFRRSRWGVRRNTAKNEERGYRWRSQPTAGCES